MMNDYPLCESVALYIDNELAAYINLAIDGARNNIPAEIADIMENGSFAEMAKDGTLPLDYCCPFDMDDLGCHCTEFDGTISPAFPGKGYFKDVELDDDFIRYVPASKEPSLFKAAYESPEELLQEFQKAVAEFCGGNLPDLPKTFNWWQHIASINGTYYC